jgi:hypothetical protein
MGLQLLACWDCSFESCQRHGCLSVMSVVCGQVEVSPSGRSLIQWSPTECGVSECDHEALMMRRAWPTGGYCVMGGEGKKETNKARGRGRE